MATGSHCYGGRVNSNTVPMDRDFRWSSTYRLSPFAGRGIKRIAQINFSARRRFQLAPVSSSFGLAVAKAWIRFGQRQPGRLAARPQAGGSRHYFWLRIHSATALVSASDTIGNGGIMTGPHLPDPPFWTCSAIFAKASGSLRYLAAMSL